MRRFFLSALLVCAVAPPAAAVCVPDLTLHIRNPEPLYVIGGDIQLWRFAFSNSSMETAYNLTITEQAGSFDQRTYAAPSLSVTLAGGGTVTSSWATDLAGPWTDGEPVDGTGAPLYLRWVVSSLPPGGSGTLSYRTLTAPGPESLLVTVSTATLSCDPASTSGAALSYSDTSTGKRIEPPLMALKLYDGSGSELNPISLDMAYAIAVDGSGNVVVAGFEIGALGGMNWRVQKYDAGLTVVLASTDYSGPGNNMDIPQSVAVDGSGNVVVAGWEVGAVGGENWRVRKYDATLTTLLASTDFNGSGNGNDRSQAVALDGSGNVVVAGYETGITGGKNWRIRKYNASLTTLLATTDYNGPADGIDKANGVAVDRNGDVVVVGDEEAALGVSNWRVRKYDSTLTALLASTSYDGSGHNYDSARAVAVDLNGNVVVAGFEFAFGSLYDWRLRKYDGTLANLLASASYDGPSNSDDEANAVAVDVNGNVVVAGFETASGGYDWRVRKYDSALNLVDSVNHDGVADGDDYLRGLATCGTGTVYVAGSETVRHNLDDFAVCRYHLAQFDPPSVPLGLTATGYAGHVGLEWSPSAPGTRGVAGYRIFRQTFAGVTEGSLLVQVAGASVSTFTDSAVVPGVAYFYRVLAVDVAGAESMISMEDSAVPACAVSPWTPRAAVPAGRMGAAGIGVGGTVYVAGGYDGSYLARIDGYNPNYGTWTHIGDMPTARYGLGVARFGGFLCFFGGSNGGGVTAVTEMWDPVANTWWTKAAMPTARYAPGVAAAGGSAYVMGGDNGSTVGVVEAYDMMFDAWATKAPLPTPRSELGAAALNGLIYAVGGTNGGGPMAVVEAYNPATNTWSTKAPMNVPRFGLGVVAVGGSLYAVGGDNAGNRATVEAYDPATNSWVLLCGLTTGRSSLAVADVGGTVYAIGGWGPGYLSSVEAAVFPKGPAEPRLYVSKVGDKGSGPCGTAVTYDVTVAYPPIEDSLFQCADDQPATSVVLTDAIPAGMTYVPGSLKRSTDNGTSFGALTDAADGDAGEVAAGTVTVRLGTIAEGDGDWNCNLAGGQVVRFTASRTGLVAATISNTVFVNYADGKGAAQPVVLSSADFTGAGCPPPPPPPAALAAWMDMSSVVPMGTSFTATVWVANTGGVSATVTGLALGAIGSPPGTVGAPGPVIPALPVVIAPLTTTSFLWSTTALACGNAILTVTVTGSEGGTGSPLGPVVVGRLVTVSGVPAVVLISASPPAVRAGSTVSITVTVYDSCSPANALNGVAVTLVVIAGGGTVSSAAGVTNIFGRLVTTLTTGTAGGTNSVWAGVSAGTSPAGTAYVTATLAPPVPPGPPLLTSPGGATDKNIFEPSKGDIVLARINPRDDSGIIVRIYTASGRLVRTLRNLEPAGSGQYVVRWDGRTEDEFVVARGVYLVHILGGGLNEVVKVVVK
ncbi:MAG: hypothetical protein AAB152_05805 [Candidatus Coatesbacteria bacterium]